jgi:dephospho-CoA kinase
MLVGLTGLSCSGKNFIARLFAERGFPVLDADEIAHATLDEPEIKKQIAARWADVLNSDGSVSRRHLAKQVFARCRRGDNTEIIALENITYPAINKKTLEWLNLHKGEICIFNAPVLHKSAVFGMIDAIIIVRAPYIARLLRALRRDKRPIIEIMRRFRSQKGFDAQYTQYTQHIKKNTDIHNSRYVVVNGFFNPLQKLEKKIDKLCESLRTLQRLASHS